MTIEYKNLRDFLAARIDLISAIKVESNKHLKATPKRFFIECIILYMETGDISSIESVMYLRDILGYQTSDNIYNWRSVLKKNKWLGKDANGKFTIRFFDFFNKPFPVSIGYEFEIKLVDTKEVLEIVNKRGIQQNNTSNV